MAKRVREYLGASLGVYLRPELVERVRRASGQRGQSMSAWVRSQVTVFAERVLTSQTFVRGTGWDTQHSATGRVRGEGLGMQLNVQMTPEEERLVREAAAKVGVGIGPWMRAVVLWELRVAGV